MSIKKSIGDYWRNGSSLKKVGTSFGEFEIDVPGNRDATFNPMIVPKRGDMVDGIEKVIIALHKEYPQR